MVPNIGKDNVWKYGTRPIQDELCVARFGLIGEAEAYGSY